LICWGAYRGKGNITVATMVGNGSQRHKGNMGGRGQGRREEKGKRRGMSSP